MLLRKSSIFAQLNGGNQEEPIEHFLVQLLFPTTLSARPKRNDDDSWPHEIGVPSLVHEDRIPYQGDANPTTIVKKKVNILGTTWNTRAPLIYFLPIWNHNLALHGEEVKNILKIPINVQNIELHVLTPSSR